MADKNVISKGGRPPGTEVTYESTDPILIRLIEIIKGKTLSGNWLSPTKNGIALEKVSKLDNQEKPLIFHRYLTTKLFIKLKKGESVSLSTDYCDNLRKTIILHNNTATSDYKLKEVDLTFLNEQFKNSYTPVKNQAKNVSENTDSQSEGFDYYIYYYFSYKRVVKPALMKIAIKEGEWSDDNGELIYYSEDRTEKTYSLKKMDEVMNHSDTEPQVAFFKAVEKTSHKVNFFTIDVNGTKLEERNIMFITYSVVETKKDILSCGYGILIKQKSEDEAKNKIINTKVDDWIVNALHDKKMSFTDFEHNVYKTEKELLEEHKQYDSISKLSGYYIGYFLRKEDSDLIEQYGRIIKTILEIRQNGLACLYYESTFKEVEDYEPRYEGFIYFPKNIYSLIKGTFAYQKESKTHRYYMFLDANASFLTGTFSGWNDAGSIIYSSPIFFERIKDIKVISEENLKLIIDKYKPKRIPNNDLGKDLIDKLKIKFKPIIEKYMNTLDNCIPDEWK